MVAFITLTAPNGNKLRVNTSNISLYYAEDHGNGNTAVEINGGKFYVMEMVDVVDSKIEEARVYSLVSGGRP